MKGRELWGFRILMIILNLILLSNVYTETSQREGKWWNPNAISVAATTFYIGFCVYVDKQLRGLDE